MTGKVNTATKPAVKKLQRRRQQHYSELVAKSNKLSIVPISDERDALLTMNFILTKCWKQIADVWALVIIMELPQHNKAFTALTKSREETITAVPEMAPYSLYNKLFLTWGTTGSTWKTKGFIYWLLAVTLELDYRLICHLKLTGLKYYVALKGLPEQRSHLFNCWHSIHRALAAQIQYWSLYSKQVG